MSGLLEELERKCKRKNNRNSRVRAKLVTSLLRLNSCAKICKCGCCAATNQRRCRGEALLRRVEDGSPTRAIAKLLQRDGVSGCNTKIIGSNELSLNAIKVTRFRENKRSNEVTKKATTQIPEFTTFLFSGGGRDGEGEGEDGGGPTEDKAKGVRAGQAVT
ncbi:hypothetical protein B0H10DRAFT_1959262 [Mycena sp. CBHHK59/15]|nr:hypothetical protein B0H10DRAFT_1959262 [Mycena sp. CBHHK59/15]